MIDRQILREQLRQSPYQPATGLFRAVELGHLIRSDVLPKTGYGFDLGCGDGHITQLIAQRLDANWRLVGLDPDPNETQLAAEIGIYEKLHTCGAEKIPEPDNTFDFVFSNSVLEHIPDLSPVLAEVSRILKPGGKFVFTVPYAEFHECLRGPGFFGRLATGESERTNYLTALDKRVAHLRYWDQKKWREELSKVGLEVRHASYYLNPRELRRWELLANLTAGLLVRFIGRNKAPIQIQRQLALRRSKPPMWISAIGSMLGQLATVGLDSTPASQTHPAACILCAAEKATA